MVMNLSCFLTPKNLRPDLPLFVFLPGMDGTGQLLRTQTEGLERLFDVRCLAIPPTDQTGWDELAERVIDLIEAELKQSGDRPVYLCGESFGGCLALKVVQQAPNLFQRMILVNPALTMRDSLILLISQAMLHWLPEVILQPLAGGLLPLLIQPERVSFENRQALLKAVQSVPKQTIVWRLSLINEFDFQETQFQQIRLPVLWLAGGADRLLPSVAEANRLARFLPKSQVVVLPNSGHACLLEQEVNLYAIMQDHHFLDYPLLTTGVTRLG
jgi:pimeloyl-ACP methyl ester carboxylesterase